MLFHAVLCVASPFGRRQGKAQPIADAAKAVREETALSAPLCLLHLDGAGADGADTGVAGVSLATLGLLEACERVGGVPLVTWAGFFFTGGRDTKMALRHRPPPDAFPWYVRTRSAAVLLE